MIPPFAIHSKRNADKILMSLEERRKFKYLISIGDPADSLPVGWRRFDGPKIRLKFDDVCKPSTDACMASVEDVWRMIEFCKRVDGPVLIHCYAGISRSAAAACILVTVKLGPGRELEALQHVDTWSKENSWSGESIIWPNKHVINLADQLLGRQGKLLDAALTLWEQPLHDLHLEKIPGVHTEERRRA